jgi:hypothetical protein
MDVEPCTPSSSSASSSQGSIQERFIKIIEVGLENSNTTKNPNHLMTYYQAQYGGKPTSIVEVFSTLTLSFPSMPSERVKGLIMKLTHYIEMSTDSLASNYEATTSEEGISLKILDRMTALVRKQREHATNGRIHFENGTVFMYEEKLKAAAHKRKEISKRSEKPVCLKDIGY